MKRRGLWISIVFVLVLVAASVGAFATGTKPVLGLDLEGGVSVILSAPEGTPPAVMDQALENIRGRIDSFGTAEPLLFVTGTNIEVQIPGLARGTIEERAKTQVCVLDADGVSYGCFGAQADAQSRLDGATVAPLVQSVCLTGSVWGDSPPCFGTKDEAQTAIDAISVDKAQGQFCLVGTGLGEDPCFPTRDEADAALAEIDTDVAQTFCVQGADDTTFSSDVGAACFPTEQEAQDALDSFTATQLDRQFCVVSSTGVQLGCSLTR